MRNILKLFFTIRPKNTFLRILYYIVFLFFFLEIVLRITLSLNVVKNNCVIEDEYSNRRRWVQFHKSYSNKTDFFYFYDTLIGWKLKPNITNKKDITNESKNNILVNTNSKGFRGKEEYSYSKPKNKVRILIIGDSFSFGTDVNDNETFPYYLQKMLPNTEIINMGVAGYGNDQMLIYLKNTGIKYKPDIVILGAILGDMIRNLQNFRDYSKPKFIQKNNDLVLTNIPVAKPEEILRYDWLRPRIIDLYSMIKFQYQSSTGQLGKEAELITKPILSEIVRICDSIQALPVFVFIPTDDQIRDSIQNISFDKAVLSLYKIDDKVKYFSTLPYFRSANKKGEKIKPTYSGHWNPEANHLIALAIKDYLLENKYCY